MFETLPSNAPHIFAFKATGELTDEDYREFLPRLEEKIREPGRISLLVKLEDFRGWKGKAAWDDLRFGLQHDADFERIAIVGESFWQHWGIALINLLTATEMRFFPMENEGAAWAWLRELHPDAPPESVPDYRHVLLATDFSPHSDAAALRAAKLAEQNGADLSIVHVAVFMPYYDEAYDPLMEDIDNMQSRQEEIARERLRELARRLGVGKSARLEVITGSPKRALLSWATEHGADLIVLGTHGRGGLDRLLGSVSRGVVNNARCDVLTIRI